MLEALVSSRTRRALLEHVLTHSQDSFYLRGLAKRLNLSISPLRRELLRLEHAGMLTAIEEGNKRFYRVNTTSPTFLELSRTVAMNPESRAPSPEPVLVGVISASSKPSFWQQPLSTSRLLAATGIGLFLVVAVASMAYLTVTNQRLIVATQQAVAVPRTSVTVVAPAPQASRAMRGGRWQLVPGSMGGFSSSSSSGRSDETY